MVELTVFNSAGTKVEVTRKGITYSDSSATPYQAMSVGACIAMVNVQLWVAGSKFTNNDNEYSYLILVVDMPGASTLTDDIFENNVIARPIPTSTGAKNFCFELRN